MKTLSKSQVLLLHSMLISETGGVDGLRDEALLDSALNMPFQTFDNQSLYPTIQSKAARLGYGLIQNHPFVDGNKRIGTHVMLIFLAVNNIELKYTQHELSEIILSIASGKTGEDDLLLWLLNHQI